MLLVAAAAGTGMMRMVMLLVAAAAGTGMMRMVMLLVAAAAGTDMMRTMVMMMMLVADAAAGKCVCMFLISTGHSRYGFAGISVSVAIHPLPATRHFSVGTIVVFQHLGDCVII